jgi:hypothetical protein
LDEVDTSPQGVVFIQRTKDDQLKSTLERKEKQQSQTNSSHGTQETLSKIQDQDPLKIKPRHEKSASSHENAKRRLEQIRALATDRNQRHPQDLGKTHALRPLRDIRVRVRHDTPTIQSIEGYIGRFRSQIRLAGATD